MAIYLRWCMEHDLMGEDFLKEYSEVTKQVKACLLYTSIVGGLQYASRTTGGLGGRRRLKGDVPFRRFKLIERDLYYRCIEDQVFG